MKADEDESCDSREGHDSPASLSSPVLFLLHLRDGTRWKGGKIWGTAILKEWGVGNFGGKDFQWFKYLSLSAYNFAGLDEEIELYGRTAF